MFEESILMAEQDNNVLQSWQELEEQELREAKEEASKEKLELEEREPEEQEPEEQEEPVVEEAEVEEPEEEELEEQEPEVEEEPEVEPKTNLHEAYQLFIESLDPSVISRTVKSHLPTSQLFKMIGVSMTRIVNDDIEDWKRIVKLYTETAHDLYGLEKSYIIFRMFEYIWYNRRLLKIYPQYFTHIKASLDNVMKNANQQWIFYHWIKSLSIELAKYQKGEEEESEEEFKNDRQAADCMLVSSALSRKNLETHQCADEEEEEYSEANEEDEEEENFIPLVTNVDLWKIVGIEKDESICQDDWKKNIKTMVGLIDQAIKSTRNGLYISPSPIQYIFVLCRYIWLSRNSCLSNSKYRNQIVEYIVKFLNYITSQYYVILGQVVDEKHGNGNVARASRNIINIKQNEQYVIEPNIVDQSETPLCYHFMYEWIQEMYYEITGLLEYNEGEEDT